MLVKNLYLIYLVAEMNQVEEGAQTPSLREYLPNVSVRADRTVPLKFSPFSPANRIISPAG